MRHISLFSGIGGDTLAAEWAGFETVLFVEIDPFCQKVLNKHWPDVPIIGDIKDVKGEEYKGTITLITGGFPCQPFSVAGKQRGKDDDRYLWPEMLRVISEVRPTWVVAENVGGFVRMGLDDCLSDLESTGYEATPFLIPACAVNAPHRRDRVFIVAHSINSSDRGGRGQDGEEDSIQGEVGETLCSRLPGRTGETDVGYSNSSRQEQCISEPEGIRCRVETSAQRSSQDVADTESAHGHRGQPRDVLSRWGKSRQGETTTDSRREGREGDGWWAVEPNVGRVAYGVPSRVDRLKSLGNAIVPQQIYPILKAIADGEYMRHG